MARAHLGGPSALGPCSCGKKAGSFAEQQKQPAGEPRAGAIQRRDASVAGLPGWLAVCLSVCLSVCLDGCLVDLAGWLGGWVAECFCNHARAHVCARVFDITCIWGFSYNFTSYTFNTNFKQQLGFHPSGNICVFKQFLKRLLFVV